MPNDPYAILRALVRAESLRGAPKPPPGTRQGAPERPEPAPEQQNPPEDRERD
ncbi:hypothetical protein ACFWBR_20535 [Streptomyces sp. NPDC060006]|uniref:hypothetical protein n=1 Tax=unclassified Streptomyces TaxID=2593676 RepID=UPI001C2E6ABC|nr:hypothetical protein [Streptomyces sp. BV286]MBV1939923.1 hypothetical protein [Streptomyces sp. BV286]